ncbi:MULTISPECIES: aldo/keto reductase [Clostridium]|uniref:General stress protein 69 n=2 Tax=Clostridium TaxID=1485 RepID=A0A151AN12_9CLOT|nr:MULTISPECIES: aldo/keto reductase [Clostridium]KYH28950.1 general stress protein 69 [Clostridium colicanis DSM 13634]MBE6044852.1 aldo/keto reductase [Clostridium thermopalmarium]PRR73217.1 General stress protein 69 [Clostridium thermopalmarium DSM 5974]PVZ25219.1 putative aldo/keto reductase-like oxidoreductase [Clostridium thermopalmarium DSM 5974]
MEKRVLGKTNFNVSIIGFGGIPIQKVSEEKAVSLIKKAHEVGINFIDSAAGYGKSEELLGYGIKETGRENWIIATKAPDRDHEGMKKAIERSLKRFQVDTIDLYQLHNVRTDEEYEKIMSQNGALRALKEAKKEGKIREIGITSHSLDIMKKAIESGEFSTIQFPYNPVERQAEEMFRRAKELNIGVIVMKPMAGGAIENKEYSLRFILENENVTTAIPGMNTVEQINENAKIGNEFVKLNEEERKIIEEEARSLGTEFCRRCGYCGPCPQGIDIPTQFLLEGYLKRYNLKDWAVERYVSQEHGAKDCISCGKCEPKCPYNLPIRNMMKRVYSAFESL